MPPHLLRARGGVGRCRRDGRDIRRHRCCRFDGWRIRGMATQVFESGGIREEVGTAGAGAGVGGVIGGLLGGVRGALLGAVIGAGGAIAATDGKDIELPAGTVVRVRLDQNVRLR